MAAGADTIITTELLLYSNFINSLKSEATKERYDYCLKKYLKYRNITGLQDLLLDESTKSIESDIIQYVIFLKKDQKLAARTIVLFVAAIVHFYTVNDITLNRKKIGMYIGDNVRANKDRAYTYQEIHNLLSFCDERSKSLVLLLASSGIRIGAVPDLLLRHLRKIDEYRLYKLSIYEGTKEEYYTFCTPEAATAIDTYLDFRRRAGEKITDDSPLFRKEFDVFGARKPQKLSLHGLNSLLQKKLNKSGVAVRQSETELTKHGKKRNPAPRAHGFRKFVETNMIRAKLQPELREMLLGHDLPANIKSYYRPDESELLEEYLKAVDYLTINEENRLRREVETLRVEKSKMDELEDEINKLKQKFS